MQCGVLVSLLSKHKSSWGHHTWIALGVLSCPCSVCSAEQRSLTASWLGRAGFLLLPPKIRQKSHVLEAEGGHREKALPVDVSSELFLSIPEMRWKHLLGSCRCCPLLRMSMVSPALMPFLKERDFLSLFPFFFPSLLCGGLIPVGFSLCYERLRSPLTLYNSWMLPTVSKK